MFKRIIRVGTILFLVSLPAVAQYHTADTAPDQQISLSELLRVVQFFNSDGFHCKTGTEDGYAPGNGDHPCAAHDSDYAPQDWRINLSELLRIVQFFNSGGYHTECGTEDNFAPGLGNLTHCAGDVWFVKSGASGDGTSWDSAFGTLQEAVNAASAVGGGEVWVAAGRYTSTTNPILTLQSNALVYGGFAGTETARDQRDWTSNKSIIDGESKRCCVFGADDATLDGFTVQHGYAIGFGGGMYNLSVSPMVVNCTFSANKAVYGGGGMCNHESVAPIVTNCVFTGNQADGFGGGGMYNYGPSSPILADCTFTGNTGSDGGGMHNYLAASPTLTHCIFTGNFSYNSGSGIRNFSSSPALFACTFTENTTRGSGGGISNDSSSPTLANCLFLENKAVNGGGMDNRSDSGPAMINCTFKNNKAHYGGALANAGPATMVNCILWGNVAPASGSEIYTYNFSPAPVVTYSCIQGGYEGTGNIADDPLLLETPGLNGRIRPASPCINAGTSTGAPGTDIRGVLRPQEGAVDMGTYELDDQDGDGVSDLWEQDHFGNLTDVSATSDTDGDGLPDLDESLYGTNPTQTDTDGDGFSDNEEVALGWDPARASGIRRVSLANSSGAEDGRSWATAFTSIQAAIDSLAEGEVWVAAGTYFGTADYVVVMKDHVHLYGGFAGTETLRDEREWTNSACIIDGEAARRAVYGADGATLDGFTVQNGCASTSDSVWNTRGGGVCNPDFASLTVANCRFTGNFASRDGGGLYNMTYTTLAVENCVFISNRTGSGDGGGMYTCEHSSVTTRNCVFSGNSTGEYGGGMYNGSISANTIYNTIFINNHSDGDGGAMFNAYAGPVAVSNCVFTGNTALSNGGGIYNTNASVSVVTNCILWGDSASDGGNEIYDFVYANTLSTPMVTYSCIAGGYGGDGNISSDPLFMDMPNGDLRLLPGSPCIDTGTAAGAPSSDILGVPRPQGAGYDMGAYEYAEE